MANCRSPIADMEIFWRLMLGHFLADFTLQTNKVNEWKRTHVWGMILHCVMHPAAYIALTWDRLGALWINTPALAMTGWSCVLVLFVLHFLEDEWRVYTIHSYGTPDNTLYFFWDQFIHYACIFLLFPLGLGELGDGLFPEKWPVIGILAVLATHYTTVLIYFIEKDLWGHPWPGDTEKYLGIAERLVILLSFLLPGHWWVPVTGAWALYRLALRRRRIQDFTWFSFAMSGAMAVLCGLGARTLYYS